MSIFLNISPNGHYQSTVLEAMERISPCWSTDIPQIQYFFARFYISLDLISNCQKHINIWRNYVYNSHIGIKINKVDF